MQQLDAVTLKHLARELHEWLAGAKVSKVQHPSGPEFLLTFWGGPPRPNHHNLLVINLQPENPFCALVDSHRKQTLVANEFEKPTALCMLLRKHLNGANLLEARTLPGERVLDLVFENYNELGNRVRLVLSLELMGKHSNMIFYDDVSRDILAVAHGVSETMSSHRELAAGLPYAPPPPASGKHLLATLTRQEFSGMLALKPPEESSAAWLNRHLAGWGLRMLEDTLALDAQPEAVFANLMQVESGELMFPALHSSEERFTIVRPDNPLAWQPAESVNALVADWFGRRLLARRMDQKRKQLLSAIEKQQKRLEKREKELIPIEDAEIESLQQTGDRLLAAVSAREVPSAPTGHKGSVTLTRYESGEPWPIDIDPSCGWVENAQIYYRRAKKAKARREAYQQMVSQLDAEKTYLLELRQWTEQAGSLADLQAVASDLAEAGYMKASTGPGKPAKKDKTADVAGIFSVISSDGLEILVGKSGQANEAIVGKLSRADDWWLHVHQMPGSHVLIRTGGQPVPDQTLLEAATLAVHFSTARNSLNVPVVYTECRYVRKIPQSYPGHVNYRQEKTVFITPDPALLDRLLQAVPA